jgi:phospholipid-binding lipoprotein MlaA
MGFYMKNNTYLLAALLVIFPEFMSVARDDAPVPAEKTPVIISETSDAAQSNAKYSSDEFELADDNTYSIEDPFEPFNRGMFMVNKGLDTVIFKPVAHVYRAAIPEVGRDRVDSVLANMKEPVNLVNAVLQGDSDKVSRSVGRFLVNTILGLGGIFDIASLAEGLEPVNEDFGKTLGTYGVETGPYIFLPVIGPSSPRDLVGRGADFFSDPFIYSVHKDGVYVRDGIKFVNTRESLLEATDNIEQTSIDEYATVRSIYAQKRTGLKK